MTDEPLDRMDALELAVTQLAGAVESLAIAAARGGANKQLDAILAQVGAARTFIGTND
jgi:hypothetical protein